MTPSEMLAIVVGAGLLLLVIVAVAVVWARGIVAEPGPSEGEKREWFGDSRL